MIVDYSAHFWGDKHIGYNVLYDHMKRGEDAVHELLTFIKERINMEDDILKCLGRHLNKANTYTTNNGSMVDAWKLTKNTIELWIEIKTTMLHNLGDLSRDVFRYQEELTKIRKKAKDIETLEAINLMQTTTTCLQKAKETYFQRCSEINNLKNSNKDWTTTSSKEYLKIRSKLNKSHIEYRQYMEKYAQIRDIFEEKILRAARMFQEHDRSHILQMKKFFLQLATLLETSHNSNAKTSVDFKQNLELIDIEEIMLRFIEEKGTGTDVPRKLNWTEADELPQELDVLSAVHSHSSSSNNSSAIIATAPNSSSIIISSPQQQQNSTTTIVNDLLILDDNWGSTNLFDNNNTTKSSSLFNQKPLQQQNIQRFKQSASEADEEDCDDSNSENNENGQQNINFKNTSDNQQSSSISTVQQSISSWLGRQKQAASHWRLKKHSASQSSLPVAVANELIINNEKLPSSGHFAEFSKSFAINEGKGGTISSSNSGGGNGGSGFSKRYQKKANNNNLKNSTIELSQTKMKRAYSQFQLEDDNFDISTEEKKVIDPLQEFGPPPPLPISEPPSLFDSHIQSKNYQNVSSLIFSNEKEQPINLPKYNIGGQSKNNNNRWSNDDSSSSSDDEDNSTQFQTTKIRQLQIRPLDENKELQKNTSLDELRSAIGQIGLPKSSTLENDPWATSNAETKTSTDLSSQYSQISNQVAPPLRAALTGDSQYRRSFAPSNDFSQSSSIFSTSNSIARARPRSHTPLIFGTSSSTFSKPSKEEQTRKLTNNSIQENVP